MADPGFISGFIGKAIDSAVGEIIAYINIAVRCRTELRSLENLVRRIMPINSDIRQYALHLQSYSPNNVPAVPSSAKEWLKKFNQHLENASDMVEQCRVPTYNVISRYRLSRKITSVIADIEAHLRDASLVAIATQFAHMRATITISGSLPDVPSSSSSHPLTQRLASIHEPRSVVGQDDVFRILRSWLIDVKESGQSLIGVVGMGGAGKTIRLCFLGVYTTLRASKISSARISPVAHYFTDSSFSNSSD